VLVVEKLGPVRAFKRSAGLVRRTWGEGLVANFSVGLILAIFWFLALIPLILGLVMAGPAGWPQPALVIGLCITVALWIVIALVSAATHVVLTSVMYQWATERPLPRQFDKDLLEGAFVRK